MRKVKITFVCDFMDEKQVVPLEAECGIAAVLADDGPVVVMAGEFHETTRLVAGLLRSLFEHEGPEAVDRALELFRTCKVHEIGAIGPSGDQVPINRLRGKG